MSVLYFRTVANHGVEHCYFANCDGSELEIAETQDVEVTGCVLDGRLAFRDMDDRL